MLIRARRMRRHGSSLATFCLCSLMLAGCVDTAKKVPLSAAAPPPVEDNVKIERVPGANLAATPLSLMSLDGAPPNATAALVSELQKQAIAHQIVLTDAKSARYLARGYFSVLSEGENTQFVYVWDVADADKHETHRLTDSVVVKGTSPQPWSLFLQQTAAELAEKSTDDLAAMLSNMPEAKAGLKRTVPIH